MQVVFRIMTDFPCLGPNQFGKGLGCRVQGLGLGPQRYTPPPGLGLEKIKKWLVWTIWWCICKLLNFTIVCIYTTKSSTQAISLFFLGPNPVVVYIFGDPNRIRTETKEGADAHTKSQ